MYSFARLAYLAPLLPRRIPNIMSYQRSVAGRSVRLGNSLPASVFLAFSCELVLLCLTKQQLTLKIAQNHKPGFRFCKGLMFFSGFSPRSRRGSQRLNLRDHIQPTESVRRRLSLTCTEAGAQVIFPHYPEESKWHCDL